MIDWESTRSELNRTDLTGKNPRVFVACDDCGKRRIISIRVKSKVIDGQMPWLCAKCIANKPEKVEKSRQAALKAWKDPQYRDKISKNSKKLWRKQEFRNLMKDVTSSKSFREKVARANRSKITDGFRAKCAKNLEDRWKDPKYRSNMVEKLSVSSTKMWRDLEYRNKLCGILSSRWQDHRYRETISKAMVDKWQDVEFCNKMRKIFASDEFRSKMSKANAAVWARPGYREKMLPKLADARSHQKRVSSLQTILYSLLDDMGIKYYREWDGHADPECVIGPYTFDCAIPLGDKTLLIECQGEYWHSLPDNARNDKAKVSYISNNFGFKYEIKHLWEHEFGCLDKVACLLKYWVGINEANIVDFSFSDVLIKECPTKECKLLLSKYHYLPNSGRGGVSYGAFLGDKLIAVCVFSTTIRQNVRIDGYKRDEIRELSRLCIHPNYQRKNFGSWLISRCIKKLPDRYKAIISYCDTTYNHDGAVYKASNFVLDGEVKPDYWYVASDGWVMHKRTLYRHASKLGVKESEYASANGYTKVWGKKKLRFIFMR